MARKPKTRLASVLLVSMFGASCTLPPVSSWHRTGVPDVAVPAVEIGLASWYGPGFHGRHTSSGEIYDQNAMTAAHRTLPLGTRVVVTKLDNGRTTEVRINDRGPFVDGRVIDLSYAAARRLGIVGPGTGRVSVRRLDGGALHPVRYAAQVAAFRSREMADRMRHRLAERFPEAYVTARMRKRGMIYRVRVGPYASRDEARRQARLLVSAGMRTLVVEEAER